MADPNERDDRFARRFRDAYEGTAVPDARAHAGDRAAWRSAPPPRRTPAAMGFWLERRTITVRPIVAMAAALAIAVAGGLLAMRLPIGPARSAPVATPATEAMPAASTAPSEAVRFVLVAPPASSVTVVGDFNGWDAAATPMHRDPVSGEWTVTVRLEAGWHAYSFVVDGERWMADPRAPMAPGDGFGERRSVVVVGEGA